MTGLILASLSCVLTLLLEEAYLRVSGFGRGLPLWAVPLEGPDGEEAHHRRQVLHYRVVKLVQFAAFGTLWVLAGSLAGTRLMTSRFGQITTQIFLMQVMRVLGRHVVSNRVFLTVLGIQQAFLTLTVPFLAAAYEDPGTPVHPVDWLSGALLTLALLALAVSFTAAMVYSMRLLTGPEQRGRSTLPPLSVSEVMARKSVRASVPGLAAATVFMLLVEPVREMSALAASVALAPALLAAVLYMDRRRLHHPSANLLAAFSYLLLLGTVLSGMTRMY